MINLTQNTSNQVSSPSQAKQLSLQFFQEVPELKEIQQPFPLSEISQQLAVRDFDNEFELLRTITETKKHQLRWRRNDGIENKKNRYPQQSIYEHSRVKLNKDNVVENASKKRSEKNDYINANYVYREKDKNTDSCIIITQAPLKQTLRDFISMIIENRIECVVMLCNVTENGKNRCYDYLNQMNLYESAELSAEHSIHNELQIRKIKVKNPQNNGKSHQFVHIFFQAWPDKNVPDNPSQIEPILNEMMKYNRVLIHCSAGLGRSGVVAVLYRIYKQNAKKSKDDKSKDKISVFGATREIRQDRYGAVQNNQQYKFIYEYIKFYEEKKKSMETLQ